MRDVIFGLVVAVQASLLLSSSAQDRSGSADLEAKIRERAARIEQKLIGWRRDIHQRAELGDQETRTSGVVAEHFERMAPALRRAADGRVSEAPLGGASEDVSVFAEVVDESALVVGVRALATVAVNVLSTPEK